ncbi:hypothetical protein SLS58_003084 [Diplodia intermedia]|uniref:Uncharacterized protein n=1 Tax=Diplodia intermedia TaxID=856260 RepID=A0ABR3TYK0_9PEZI
MDGGMEEYVRVRAHEIIDLPGPKGDDCSIYVRQNMHQQGPEKTYASRLLDLRQLPRIEEGYKTVTMLGDHVHNRDFVMYPDGVRLAAVLVLERMTTPGYYKQHRRHRPGEDTRFAVLFGSSHELPIAVDACEWTDDSSGVGTADLLADLATSFKPQPLRRGISLGHDRVKPDDFRALRRLKDQFIHQFETP